MKTYEVNKGGGVYEVIEVGDEIDAIIRRVAHQECDGSCDIALC